MDSFQTFPFRILKSLVQTLNFWFYKFVGVLKSRILGFQIIFVLSLGLKIQLWKTKNAKKSENVVTNQTNREIRQRLKKLIYKLFLQFPYILLLLYWIQSICQFTEVCEWKSNSILLKWKKIQKKIEE